MDVGGIDMDPYPTNWHQHLLKHMRKKTYSTKDSTRFLAIIDSLVKSKIAASGLIPALSDKASKDDNPPVDVCFNLRVPRFNFLRKSRDSAIVAENTKVCRFFLWRIETVEQFCTSWGCFSIAGLAAGSMSIIDCNSWKCPFSIIRSASSSTKNDNECNCKYKTKILVNLWQCKKETLFYMVT